MNLFSTVPTLTEEYGMDYLQQEIPRRSSFLRRLEQTQGHATSLVNRIKSNMSNAVKVVSYQPLKARINLEVNVAGDLYLGLNTVEAAYQEKGSKKTVTVQLQQKEKGKEIYTGILDISDWKKTDGEVRISIVLRDGTRYRDVVCRSLQELLDDESGR